MTKHDVHFSSGSDEWATPPPLFNALSGEFLFNLDAASTHTNALCSRHLTAEDDALSADWLALTSSPERPKGAVWLNPPYSRGLQAKFLQKARNESAKFLGPIVCCLIPARPDTLIWHKTVFPCASEIRFLKGRVRFVGAKASAPFPSALVIFGQDNERQKVGGWDWKSGKPFAQ